jgi:hypothetical protein
MSQIKIATQNWTADPHWRLLMCYDIYLFVCKSVIFIYKNV